MLHISAMMRHFNMVRHLWTGFVLLILEHRSLPAALPMPWAAKWLLNLAGHMAHGAVNASPIRRCPCPFCFVFFWACSPILFWGGNVNSWLDRGSNYGPPVPDAPTLPILHPAKILCRYPNVRPSVTFTAPPRDYLSELRQTLPALARHVQPFFPRSLRAHADDQSSTAVESF